MKLKRAKPMSETAELSAKKTVLAQAMENLQMGSDSSSSAHSQDSPQSQDSEVHKPPLPDDNELPFERNLRLEYSGLDAFTNASDSETDTETNEVESQEMSEEDTAAAAGFFVETGAGFVESMFSVPVTIDHDTKQVIAQKAVPVIAKYAKGATLPPWLIRYREEFELVGVLMMAGLSIYKQINAQKKVYAKAEKHEKSNMEFSPLGEVVTSGS